MTEAAVGEERGKGLGKLRALLSRPKKRDEDVAAAKPAGYETFSNKLAPGLVALGSVLSIIGALGAWIRTSRVVSEGLPEEQVDAVMGYEADWGRLMAAVAALALLSAIAWVRRNLLLKLLSLGIAGAVIVLSVIRLPVIDDHAAGLAYEARTGEIGFISFHAGFGWGAWCLVVGAVALFLGASAGVLREFDVRKGFGT